jgi:hypothetical protein
MGCASCRACVFARSQSPARRFTSSSRPCSPASRRSANSAWPTRSPASILGAYALIGVAIYAGYGFRRDRSVVADVEIGQNA